jgi:hypothetical protein
MRMTWIALALATTMPATAMAQVGPSAPAAETSGLGASTLPPVDPALLAQARPIASIILPDGTMARMMGPMMQKIMAPMMDSFTKMPIRDLLKAGGIEADKADALNPATIEEIMAILDPNFRKRMDVMLNTMMPALGQFMGRFEPDMREGMAEAFASRYNAAELGEISAFMKTPTGAKFGSGFMELAADPHYLGKVQAMIPEMMRAMPEILQKSVTEMGTLPKPRTYKDLTPAERQRLEALIGLDSKKVTQ